MYDNAKFKSAKQDIVYALMYDAKETSDKAATDYLWRLLRCAVYNGVIEDEDVEHAIEQSGVLDLQDDTTLIWARYTGNYYLGEVSFAQMLELRTLQEHISMLKNHGEIEMLRKIADMIE